MRSREIRFRAWVTANGEDYMMISPEQVDVDWEYHKKNSILMQFTGLQDKNGKDIYESDIVLFSDGWAQNEHKEVVKYRNAAFTNCHRYDSGGATIMLPKVVGDIYYSPELLEKSND